MKDKYHLRRLGRILWRAAWGVQALLWLIPLIFFGFYHLVEKPRFTRLEQAGLADGFNGLAGIIASSEPEWDTVREIRGHGSIPLVDTFLDRRMAFNVWLDLDERKGWHSGSAIIQYDKDGRLAWVAGSSGGIAASATRAGVPPRAEHGATQTVQPSAKDKEGLAPGDKEGLAP